MAIAASAKPMASEPVSPMNTRAGYLLNTRNATRAPHKVIATAFSPAGAPSRSNAIVAIAITASPPASPSMPSVMFTALAVATMAATASGKTDDRQRHENNAASGRRAGFLLVRVGQLFLDHLPRLQPAKDPDGLRIDDQREGEGDDERAQVEEHGRIHRRDIRWPGGPDARRGRAPERAHRLIRERGAEAATTQTGCMGAEDPSMTSGRALPIKRRLAP